MNPTTRPLQRKAGVQMKFPLMVEVLPSMAGYKFRSNETRSKAIFILVAKSALHFPRGLRWAYLAGNAPSDNSP